MLTLNSLYGMKQAGDKIACLTCYDASFAEAMEASGLDVLLVGDSLGMVIQGQKSTLACGMEDILYHCKAVSRVSSHAWLIADLPFRSYLTPGQGVANAARLMQEGGVNMVKLEGGKTQVDTISAITRAGIPVCAHLGLLPQSVHKLGGYRVQGRDGQSAEQLLSDAELVQAAGADMLVLECVPADLAKQVTEKLDVPVIGIGAGPDCDGQVLVVYDMLGLGDNIPRFSKNFLQAEEGIQQAFDAYVRAVRAGTFPAEAHGYK